MTTFDKDSFINMIRMYNGQTNNFDIDITNLSNGGRNIFAAGVIASESGIENNTIVDFGNDVRHVFRNINGLKIKSVPFILKIDTVHSKSLKVKILINESLELDSGTDCGCDHDEDGESLTRMGTPNLKFVSRGAGPICMDFSNRHIFLGINYNLRSLYSLSDHKLVIDDCHHLVSTANLMQGSSDTRKLSINIIMSLTYDLEVIKIIEPNNISSSIPRDLSRNLNYQGDRMLDMKYKNGILYVLAYVARESDCKHDTRGAKSMSGYNFGNDDFSNDNIYFESSNILGTYNLCGAVEYEDKTGIYNRSLFVLAYFETLTLHNACHLDGFHSQDYYYVPADKDGREREITFFDKDPIMSLSITNSNIYLVGTFNPSYDCNFNKVNIIAITDSSNRSYKKYSLQPKNCYIIKLTTQFESKTVKEFKTSGDSRFLQVVDDNSGLYVLGLITNQEKAETCDPMVMPDSQAISTDKHNDTLMTEVDVLPFTDGTNTTLRCIGMFKFDYSLERMHHYYYEYSPECSDNDSNMIGLKNNVIKHLPCMVVNNAAVYLKAAVSIDDGDNKSEVNRGYVIRNRDTIDEKLISFSHIDANDKTYYILMKLSKRLKVILIDHTFVLTRLPEYTVRNSICATPKAIFCSYTFTDDNGINLVTPDDKKDTDKYYIPFDKLYEVKKQCGDECDVSVQGIGKFFHFARLY